MRNEEIIGKFAPLVAKLADRQVVSIPVLPGSAGAALAWSLQRETGRPIVWIADSPHSMESAQSDMLALCPCDGPAPDASSVGPESPVLYYPPRETPVPASRQPDTGAGGDPDLTGYRLKTLLDLAARRGGFNPTQVSGASGPGKEVRGIVTCVQALMQKTVPPDRLLAHTFFLRAGQESDMERLEAFLAGHGYEFGAEVQEKGAAAVRGGLIDVWSVTERWPVRVEFAHGAVESIRFFDPADQRSVQKVELIAIAPRDERPLAESERPAALSAVAEYLPEDSVLIWPAASAGSRAKLGRWARQVCNRKTGVGADGLLLLSPSRNADRKIEVYNADGSWAEKSGNGLRIAGVHVYLKRRGRNRRRFEFETANSIDTVSIGKNTRGGFMISAKLERPCFETSLVPVRTKQRFMINSALKIGGVNIPVTCLSVGNPHTVLIVSDFDFDWKILGSEIEIHRAFPNRTNVEFVKILNRGKIQVADWERGAGATGSSGTGAAASVCAGVIMGLLNRKCEVVFDTGSLFIEWPESSGVIQLSGPVEHVCDGIFDFK